MAFTTFLMTVSVMVAIASAGFPGWPDDDNPFPGFRSPMMSSMGFGPMGPPPSMPGMLTFPQHFPFQFPGFPAMPTFPPMPSFPDIADVVPENGESFTGVVITSKSQLKRKEDGTMVKETDNTIITNTDGVVSIKHTGNNSSKIPTKIKTKQNEFDFDDLKIKPSNPNLFKNYNFKKNDGFNNFGFRHQFPTIDPKKIETYKPGEGETFTGKSIRTRTSYTNVNGKVNEEGSETRIENDNGRVNKEKVVYKSDGTQS